MFQKTQLPLHPKHKFSYAVLHGTYCGEILVYIKTIEDNYQFIAIPKNENREVPKNQFQIGLAENIIDPVRQIPKGVWMLLKKQYDYNQTHKLDKAVEPIELDNED